MSTRILTFLLAAGLAASKPIANPYALQALAARQGGSAQVNTSPNPGFDIASSLLALESKAKQELTQVNPNNFIVVDIDIGLQVEETAGDGGKGNGDVARKVELDMDAKRLMLQQVNHALAIDQQANAANNERDNVLRAMALLQKEPEKSIVILLVQEIIISIELEVDVDNEGRERKKLDARMYKQEAIVANRGMQETQTVMIYNPRTLTATDTAVTVSEATATEIANTIKPTDSPATRTIEAVLYNVRPTYTSIAEDPAASMGAALEAALGGREKEENRAKDVELNIEIAIEIRVEIEKNNGKKDNENDRDVKKDQEREKKQKLDEAQRAQEEKQQQQQQQEEEKEDERQKEQDLQKEEQERQQKEQEKQKAEQEKQKAEQEKQRAEQKAEQEKQKAEQEKQRVEQEKQKAEQEKQKAEQEKQKAEQEKQKAEQKAEQEKQRVEQEKQKAEQEKQKAEQEKQRVEQERQKAEEDVGRKDKNES